MRRRGGEKDVYPNLERTSRAGFMARLAMGSLGLTCNGIYPKMSRLKLSACLRTSEAVDIHVLCLSCAIRVVAVETRNIAYSGPGLKE